MATIGRTFPSTWQRFKALYIAAALGLSLAVAGAIGTVAWPDGGSALTATPPSIAVPSSVAPQASVTTIYLVDSQARADLLAASSNEGFSDVSIVLVNANPTAEEQQALQAMFAENASGDANTQIVDLRGR